MILVGSSGKARVVFVCVLALLGASFLLWWKAEVLFSTGPSLACPAEIIIESAEIGKRVRTSFLIGNDGGEPLVIDHIRTNCHCNGLETLTNKQFISVNELTIAPHSNVQVFINHNIVGIPGQQSVFSISFLTNVHHAEEHFVKLIIKKIIGGVAFSPDEANFGTIPCGEERTIDISCEPGSDKYEEVTACTFARPCAQLKCALVEAASSKGSHVLHVTASSSEPGQVENELVVYFKGSADPRRILTRATFAPRVRSSKRAIMLPLRSSNGPVYETSCELITFEGDRVSAVTVQSAPAHLTIAPVLQEEKWTIRLKLDSHYAASISKLEKVTVILHAVIGDKMHVIQIPVSLMQGAGR